MFSRKIYPEHTHVKEWALGCVNSPPLQDVAMFQGTLHIQGHVLFVTQPEISNITIVIIFQFSSWLSRLFVVFAGLGFNGAQIIYYFIFRHIQTTKNCQKLPYLKITNKSATAAQKLRTTISSARHWIPTLESSPSAELQSRRCVSTATLDN